VELEVPRRGLAVDQAVGLDGRFLGVALALNREPALEAPPRGPAIRTERPRVAVEHIGVNPLEKFVGFKLALDLRQERLGYRLHHAENGDRNFGIAEHFPNGTRESDDGRFVVEPGPQFDTGRAPPRGSGRTAKSGLRPGARARRSEGNSDRCSRAAQGQSNIP
jgi:hypothetical protein